MKLFRRKKFFVGTLHRALVVRTTVNYCRMPGLYVRFDDNSVVIVNKKLIPVSTRVYGPILRELCVLYPTLGCIAQRII